MQESSLVVEPLVSLSDDDEQALAALLPQLSASAVFDRTRVLVMLHSEVTELFVARRAGRIVGMATLVVVPLTSGVRGHVEDVVVDRGARGGGIARALLEQVAETATARGVRTLDLTSRPTRESALRLYESVGFVRRDTAVLRYEP